MIVTYSKWLPRPGPDPVSYKQLLDLFNQILTQVSGDVALALEILNEINRHQPLFEEVGGLDAFIEKLEEEGLLRREGRDLNLTPAGEREIRKSALEHIFSDLKKRGRGFHRTPYEGEGVENLAETRPYLFGDAPEHINYLQTFKNSLKRGLDFAVAEDDIEVFEQEHLTHSATVIMIDISHSMILYGEDRITPAKTVAMALSELIMKDYPKDSLEVVLFFDDAKQIGVKDIPYVQVGPYHTNTCEGLRMAREILRKKKCANKQIFMITDGKPTVVYHKGRVYRNTWGMDPLIINRTLDEAVLCKRQDVVISTFMIAREPYLIQFVEQLTQLNGGRAYYADLDNLGSFVFSDYVQNRRRRKKLS